MGNKEWYSIYWLPGQFEVRFKEDRFAMFEMRLKTINHQTSKSDQSLRERALTG